MSSDQHTLPGLTYPAKCTPNPSILLRLEISDIDTHFIRYFNSKKENAADDLENCSICEILSQVVALQGLRIGVRA